MIARELAADDQRAHVIRIVAEHTGTPTERVTPASIIRDLDGDSIDHVELVMAIEEDFATAITDDEWERIVTVGQLIELVERKAAEE